MIKCEKLFSAIEKLYEKYLSVWEDVCNIESPSECKKGVHTDDTYIYDPGVTDCKGGIVAGFMAIEALKNCGFASRPVRMILQTDYEVGSSHIDSICSKAKVTHSKGRPAMELNLRNLKLLKKMNNHIL